MFCNKSSDNKLVYVLIADTFISMIKSFAKIETMTIFVDIFLVANSGSTLSKTIWFSNVLWIMY